MRDNLSREQLRPLASWAMRMPLAPSTFMNALRSTLWGVVIVLALIFIAMVGYGSCYSRP